MYVVGRAVAVETASTAAVAAMRLQERGEAIPRRQEPRERDSDEAPSLAPGHGIF